MAGAHVFPGGRLDEADLAPELSAYATNPTPEDAIRRLREPGLAPRTALGLHWTAVRETLEEAGLLIALADSHHFLDSGSPEARARLNDYQQRIHALDLRFEDMAASENIKFDLSRLVPYSRWITPDVETKRYDTRFFIAIAPQNQSTVPDTVEMSGALWIEPSEALEQHHRQDIMLMPPTLVTLEELAAFDSPDSLPAAAQHRDMRPILPQAFIQNDMIGLKLPDDPEYSLLEYKQPSRPAGKTRLYLVDGRWKRATGASIP
jgi:8-oxo-dGTP pyrophosphatase MutT (NUDIX family)